MGRLQSKLDDLPKGAVILDEHGHAWQYDGWLWYRAYSTPEHGRSSFELAQCIEAAHPMVPPKSAPKPRRFDS